MEKDIVIEVLDSAPLAKRRRRYRPAPPVIGIGLWPAPWKELLVRWLRRAEQTTRGCRWETLTRDAGPARYPLAQQLLEKLVTDGWIALIEERRHGAWLPRHIEFRHRPALRSALGLADPEATNAAWQQQREYLAAGDEAELSAWLADLDTLPEARAIARAELLLALRRWRREQRSGSRRDFSQFARGATKAVSESEWGWLEQRLELAAVGIERHTPLLRIAAPLRLRLAAGRIDLGCVPDFIALTPDTLASAHADNNAVERWRLVENLTSFERVARQREAGTGVIWLPGYPPGSWQTAVKQLLALAPAPAEIACDPDPAGISIALATGALWQSRSLPWQAWRMAPDLLAALPRRLPLSVNDREMLSQLLTQALPAVLEELAQWMHTHGEKGEQEGYL